MLNQIVLIGRMVREPEMRALDNGTSYCNFTIAVDADFKSDGEKVTDFFDGTAWRKSAEFMMKYLTKGDMVAVVGQMRSRKWVDKDGNKRISWSVNCDNVYSVGSRKSGEGQMPQAGATGYPAPAAYPAPAVPQFVEITDDDAQLPF